MAKSNTSEKKANQDYPWRDDRSVEADMFLNKQNIPILWHYNDFFGSDYKVIGIRSGGLGVVFFVKSIHFENRIYAAKTLQKFLLNNFFELPIALQEEIANGFLQEALPWLQMGQHPNIVPVQRLEHIVHTSNGRNVPFIFSEFIERGDLKDLIIEKTRLSFEDIFSLSIQVCEGLLHAYKHGISAHKDLKPENIMVYGDGIYRVIDFSAGDVYTPSYMAPEQMARVSLSHHVDQFALGLIIHDILSGDILNSQAERIEYIYSNPNRFMREGISGIISNDLPSCLKDIIIRCLQPKIEDRFGDISHLKNELLKKYMNYFNNEFCYPFVETDDSAEWWYNRGKAFYNVSRYAAAELPFKEAINRLDKISGREEEKALCLINLANIHDITANYSNAIMIYERALRIYKQIPETELAQALCLMNLGLANESVGRLTEAENMLQNSLNIFKNFRGSEADQAKCFMNLGGVYLGLDDIRKAEENYKIAINSYNKLQGYEGERATCLGGLGVILAKTGKYEDAERLYRDALKIFSSIPGSESLRAGTFVSLGEIYEKKGRFSDAEKLFTDAKYLLESIPGREVTLARMLSIFGNFYLNRQKYPNAEEMYLMALQIFENISAIKTDTRSDYLNCLMRLANFYEKIFDLNEAIIYLEKVIEICDLYPKGTEDIKEVCSKRIELLSGELNS
jgi:serine/threonine protein kinase/Tfp pilus assembly protein PilF